jgi:hypothetical protein
MTRYHSRQRTTDSDANWIRVARFRYKREDLLSLWYNTEIYRESYVSNDDSPMIRVCYR